jgi:hypothetical protein
MSSGEVILKLDPHLNGTARNLVHLIASYFSNQGRASLYDTEASAIAWRQQCRSASRTRHTLERKGYLSPLHFPQGKPRYALKFGRHAAAVSNEYWMWGKASASTASSCMSMSASIT